MRKPDDKVIESLGAIDRVLAESPVHLVNLKTEVVRLLEHLSSPAGRTDQNCRAVDLHFCVDDRWRDVELPADFHGLFTDMGGALHDTVSHPDIAKNFDSAPEQLLARAKELNTEQGSAGDPDVHRDA